MDLNKIYLGDSLELIKTFPDNQFDCVVTSPPYYGLRDYGADGQIGLEDTPEEYIGKLVELFREIRRCLKDTGTIWVNIGDSYCGTGDKGDYRDPKYKDGRNGQSTSKNKNVKGCKHKDLIGIPWMLAFALRADGWYLRQDIIWHKPNPMPESVTDRCTKSHEYIFLLSKSEKYYFDYEAVMEECADQERVNYQSGNRTYGVNNDRNDNDFGQRSKEWKPKERDGVAVRNKRDVWTVYVKPNKEAHFATYPEELIVPCIIAGCPEGGVVLDPFMGSGTTGIVARKLNRNYVGCELNPDYQRMGKRRIFNEGENLFNQS